MNHWKRQKTLNDNVDYDDDDDHDDDDDDKQRSVSDYKMKNFQVQHIKISEFKDMYEYSLSDLIPYKS